mgnify:CR=1 FL=1
MADSAHFVFQDNLFEWHFTIRGPKDTEFEGGVYHGRILFPSDYPYRPPDIVFLTVRNFSMLICSLCAAFERILTLI